MRRQVYIVLVLLVLSLAFSAPEAGAVLRVRRPAGPGIWYPADPAELRQSVEQYVEKAEDLPLPGRYAGCVVPYASYEVCGEVAGHAFKPLQRGQYDRVVVLAPATQSAFRGCSIAAVHVYRTPLGDIPLDGPAIGELTSSLIQFRAVSYRPEAYVGGVDHAPRVKLHENEYSLEVVLPFLQVQLGEFKLVPIIVGDLKGYRGQRDEDAIRTILQQLRKLIDDRTFVVVCSNFTQYGPSHDYTPFRENIPQGIASLDMEAFELVKGRDYDGFCRYLARTRNPIQGQLPISFLMRLLAPSAKGVLLRYDTSGRISGNTVPSISYAAIAFFDPKARPAVPRPLSVDTSAAGGQPASEDTGNGDSGSQ
jgi:MEMO1 family protein